MKKILVLCLLFIGSCASKAPDNRHPDSLAKAAPAGYSNQCAYVMDGLAGKEFTGCKGITYKKSRQFPFKAQLQLAIDSPTEEGTAVNVEQFRANMTDADSGAPVAKLEFLYYVGKDGKFDRAVEGTTISCKGEALDYHVGKARTVQDQHGRISFADGKIYVQWRGLAGGKIERTVVECKL